MPFTNTAVIAHSLSGIDFPANKQKLVEYARQHQADQEVLDVINKMPDSEYLSMADVFKGVGEVKH